MNLFKSHVSRITLTAATSILCLAARSLAVNHLSIVVSGYEDHQGVVRLWVTNGTDVVECAWAEWADHDVTMGEIYVEESTDADGNPIPSRWDPVEYWVNQRTGYTVDLPDAWLGRNISFSNNGADWTAMYPLLNAENTMSVDMVRTTTTNPATNTTIQGNNILTGKWWDEPNRPVFTIGTWDTANPYWPGVGIDFMASTSNAFFRWMHPPGLNEETSIGMELNHLHQLTLRGRSNNNHITLDPEGAQISINGAIVITNSNRGLLVPYLQNLFIGKSARGINLAPSEATFRSQFGLPPQLLLGARNNPVTDDGTAFHTDHTQGVLIVGSLTEPGTNGLRILDDGTVLIQPKGDLSMGGFENGVRP